MMSIFFLFLLILPGINGKFLLNSESSSIIVVRHIRLLTDNEYYHIRCPYHLKHITLTLLNYSNDYCFDLHTKSINDICVNYRSPCRLHAKPIQLDCQDQTNSNQVDITYHCSFLPSIPPNTPAPSDEQEYGNPITNLNSSSDVMTLHTLSFPSSSFGIEETIGIFILSLAVVFILWLTVCCVWFIRCGRINSNDDDDDGKCELLAFRPCQSPALMDLTRHAIVGNLSGHTNTGGIENICLHVNPLENKPISSLKITQID